MIKVILLYMLITASIAGVFYGVPELKKYAVKHKQRAALAFGLGMLIVIAIYQLEAL